MLNSAPPLIAQSAQLLHKMFNPNTSLFAGSSAVVNGQVVNDFTKASWCIRYTINSIAGIQEAQTYYDLGFDVKRIVAEFLKLHSNETVNLADKGLLLHVLAREQNSQAEMVFERLADVVTDERNLSKLSSQVLCWMLTGLVTYSLQNPSSTSAEAAKRLHAFLLKNFLNQDTGLPYFQLDVWRKPFVSFGAITYYLKALAEYATAFNDEGTERIFRRAVGRIIERQGPQGEWPWLFNVNAVRVMDWYPVFSVHQDAMAMLFLLPALNRGISGAESAISKSYRWLFGQNCLGAQMITQAPFFIFRSIQRSAETQRFKRFARSVLHTAMGTQGSLTPTSGVSINTECRSYHIGWILYAWAAEKRFPEFTELHSLPTMAGTTRSSTSGAAGKISATCPDRQVSR